MIHLSIIVPVYNRAHSIGAALASIEAHPDVEVIVVDDGSSDGSGQAAQEVLTAQALKGQVVSQKNAGAGVARNTGAAHATGEWLVFLDSDDAWLPGTLARLQAALREDPQAGLVFLATLDHVPGARPKKTPPGAEVKRLYDSFLAAVCADVEIRFASCNAAMPRALFEAVGGFPTDIRCSEDTDLFLRAGRGHPCLVLLGPPLVAHQVEGADSLSGNMACVLDGYRYLQRGARAGRYGAPQDRKLQDMMARSAVYTARIAFAEGYPGVAYTVTFGAAYQILTSAQARWFLRLLLTPLAALIRPKSYRFRLRPAKPS